MGFQAIVPGVNAGTQGGGFGAGTSFFESGAGALITTERVKKSFSYQVQRLMPNGAAPLFGMLSMMKEQKAVQIEHGFQAKIQLFPQASLNTAVSVAGTTSLVTFSNAQLQAGMLLMYGNAANPQIELMLVTGVNGDGVTITVQRNVGATGSAIGSNVDPIAANASIPSGATLFVIGNAQGEGSSRPASFLSQRIRVTNYTQIFRNTWSISDTIRATEMLIGENSATDARQECAMYHAIGIEAAAIFGRLSTGSATWNAQGGSLPFRTMNGVIASLEQETLYPNNGNAANAFANLPADIGTTGGAAGGLGILGGTGNAAAISPVRNYFSCASIAGPNPSGATIGITSTTAGQINWTDLQYYLEQTLNQTSDPRGSNERVIFCGGGFLTTMVNLARFNAVYWIDGQTTEWGLTFRTLKTARGTFRVIEHPLFNSVGSNLAYAALVLDLPSLSIAYLGDRKQRVDEYNTDGYKTELGVDAIGGTVTSECTIECRNPPAFAFIANAKTAVTG